MSKALHPFFNSPAMIIFGHRGAAGEVPENTIESFRHGLASGATVIESDLRLTGDGAVVMMHDPAVNRTTNGQGPVSSYTLRELRALDAGYRFSPDGGATYPFRAQGLRVPTLEEALRAFPGASFNLEIKEDSQPLVERAVGLVRALGREEGILLTAENGGAMKKLRAEVAKTGARVALGASKPEILRFMFAAAVNAAPPPGVMALQVPRRHGVIPVLTEKFLAHARRHGVQVHVWTINDTAEMKELRGLGVNGIFTDFPGRAAAPR